MHTTRSMLGVMEQITDLLDDTGTACDYGCRENSLPNMIEKAQSLFPGLPVRALKTWQWLDIDYSATQTAQVSKQGLRPVKLRADHVIYDDTGEYGADNWIITSLMRSFSERCICEMEDAIYILVEPGKRKTVTPEALEFFWH